MNGLRLFGPWFGGVEDLRTQLFTFLPLLFHLVVVLQKDLFVGIVDFLVGLVETKGLLNITHCFLVLLLFVSCQSSFVDGFGVIGIDDDGLIVDEFCFFPLVLAEETRADVEQQIRTEFGHFDAFSLSGSYESVGFQQTKCFLIDVPGLLVVLTLELFIAVVLDVDGLLDAALEVAYHDCGLRGRRDGVVFIGGIDVGRGWIGVIHSY